MYQKWPSQIFPIVNCVFSRDGHFGLGGGGGGTIICLPGVGAVPGTRGQGSMRTGGRGGLAGTPPPPRVPLWPPPKVGQKILKRKSSWHRRRRKEKFGCRPQTLEREGGEGGATPPSSCGVRPFPYFAGRHQWSKASSREVKGSKRSACTTNEGPARVPPDRTGGTSAVHESPPPPPLCTGRCRC